MSRSFPAQSTRRLSQAWRTARLSAEFVLDVSKISRGGGDLLDPLILTAILEANQAEIRRDPRLAQIYIDGPTPLPDERRRPISVHAVAKSLRLPFESVRRRVNGWVEAGMCVRTPSGVYVPQAFVTSEPYLAIQAGRVERLARFERDLMAAGVLSREALGGEVAPIVRAADRCLAEYMLRVSDQVIGVVGGPTDGFVLLGLAVANADGRAQPVAAVAAYLGMPAETVRRRLLSLQGLGLAERSAGGWAFAAPRRLAAEVLRRLFDNEANLRRLFSSLADLRKAPDLG